MLANDSVCVHMRQFLEQQRGERYRAFVIHGPPLSGKTTFARRLVATTPGGIYLDMLEYITQRPELTERVDIIDAKVLHNIVIGHAAETSAQVLLVDEIDFLVHIWGDDLAEFKYLIESLSVTQTPTITGFVLQSYHDLEEWNLLNNAKQNRILHIEDIIAI